MLSCGNCEYCRADLDKYCSNIEGIGHDIDGGYAEYLRMPKHGIDTGKLISVPDTISPEELIFWNRWAVVSMRCARQSSIKASLFSVQVPLVDVCPTDQKGGLQTFVLEPLAHRRSTADEVGADTTFDITAEQAEALIEQTNGGVDTVISATVNDQRAIDLAFKIVRRGGCVNFFGLAPGGQELRINLEHFHYMGHKLMASWAFSRWSLTESRNCLSTTRLTSSRC